MKFAVLPSLVFAFALSASAAELVGERAASEAPCPTPEEAQRKMTVPEGYAVRCFAHEPMVQNPVAMTWDHRGRLWLVELYEYPKGTPLPVEKRPFGGPVPDGEYRPVPENCKALSNPIPLGTRTDIPKDRVIILEDTDNDGVADKRTVFLEGLDMGSAIICGDGGVYVGQQPHLLHFKDTDGDDHADEWRVCLTGFGREDTHELLNSLTWGPDGWLYMTHGVFTNSKVRRPGEPESAGFKFDAGIGRCRPVKASLSQNSIKPPAWEFEVFADGTSNPWGTDFDKKGNFFVSACVIDHLFHMAPGGIYTRQGGAPENPYSYELLPSIVDYKHFRAAYAGIQIYQSDVYPKDTHGHLFIGNIHDNAIHEEQVDPVGASFEASPVRDFLRANDGWFRPVSTQTGPDGVLWVMDWCDKYPCYQNAMANPEGVDRARGRIWRVVYTGDTKEGEKKGKKINVNEHGAAELVKLLEHPNSWMRRKARRAIVESWNAESSRTTKAPPHVLLSPLILEPHSLGTTLEAAWTLVACDNITPEVLKALAESKEPALRVWAARLAGEEPDGWVTYTESKKQIADGFSYLPKLGADPEPSVRAAVALALRQSQSLKLTVTKPRPEDAAKRKMALETCMQLIKSGATGGDVYLPFAIWQALEPLLVSSGDAVLKSLATLPPDTQALASIMISKSMRRLSDSRDVKNLNRALTFCDSIKTKDALLAAALQGLAKAQENGVLKPTVDFAPQIAAWRVSANAGVRRHGQDLAVLWGDEGAIAELVTRLLDPQVAVPERLTALKGLRKVKTESAHVGYVKALGSIASEIAAPGREALVVEVLRAAPDLGDDTAPDKIVPLWKSLAPAQRAAATETLVAREPWALKLLEAVKTKGIPAADVPMTVVRKLATHANEGIKKQAGDIFGVVNESDATTRDLVSDKRSAAMRGEPNLAVGKVLFQGTCAVCHTFFGGGQNVGPELIGSGRSNLDALLANIIDPNQIIGNGYEAINVTTKDKRLISGRLIEDTPSHIKLLAIGGAEQVVSRDQVESLVNTHQSLMPMGFGALPDDAFRDLVWYILAPPEEGPLTPQKKAALSARMDAPAQSAQGPIKGSRSIDWESVSLWNPSWKVSAPDFERTPVKLPEFHGRKNVLLMHPFDAKTPASLEQTVTLESGKPHQLTVVVAAHDQGDWELRVVVNGEAIKKETIGHEGERWKTVTTDLSAYGGKEIKIRLDGAANGWAWEFGYWGEVKLD